MSLVLSGPPAIADLRVTPGWYDQNAVTTAPDWHYRIPINVPAGATVNSTIKLDVDFAAQLAALGVSGTFDVNSPRVVRSTGVLSTNQEFTDSIYGGTTDTVGNARGEVRFILQDAGAVTYWLYFDTTQNGTKAANPQVPINGNFERDAAGTAAPTGWTLGAVTAGFDSKVTPAETVSVTSNPTAVDGVATRLTDGNPLTGSFAYLVGLRSAAGGGITTNPGTTLSKSFTIPATGAGDITIRWRPEGWDTQGFDPIRIDLINSGGTVLTEIVGPTAGSFSTKPYAPNTGSSVASNTVSGYRQYNGYDCTLLGVHTSAPPMAVTCHGEPWFTATQALSTWAGQTVSIRVRMSSDAADKTWYHIDDFEWSVVTATLGSPQAFGANITAPAAGGSYIPGQAIPLTVQVDANPTAATTPVTAAIFDSSGTQLATGFILYNDGTHGDVTAGDAIWSNNNSLPAQPAPTVPLSAPLATGYILRVYARDGSTSTISAQNGLIRGPGSGTAAETQANYWNIDEITFNVSGAALSATKISTVLSDPINGTTNPKMIPGASVRYCILLSNAGPMAATSIVQSDPLPATTVYQPGSLRSGTNCASAATVEDDDAAGADESDPFGAGYASGILSASTASLASGGTMAITFIVTLQ